MAERDKPSLAAALYPGLRSGSPEAQQREAQEAKDKAWRERDRQNLLRTFAN
jgi:hypothetical protein